MNQKKVLAQLEKIPMGRMYFALQRALIRLQLFSIGKIQEILIEFGKDATAVLLKHADADGNLDGVRGLLAQRDLDKLWTEAAQMYGEELAKWREQAVMLPYGVMARYHDELVVPVVSSQPSAVSESIDGGVFEPQFKPLLDVAGEHLYGDGIDLSQRIWKWDQQSKEGINQVLMKGIANGDSAWNIAKELEQYLGYDQDCPRWTSTRLYKLTKTDIQQGNPTGLLSDKALVATSDASGNTTLSINPCDRNRGVSYNALRLARNEIQKAHALATDKVLASQPWVEMEKCNLSPSHAGKDECDEVVAGGENGDGVYPVGTIEYPLHPHCLCFKTAVLMDEKEFTSNLNAWLKGESFPEMDAYAENMGVDLSTDLSNDPVSIALAVWAFSDDLEEWMK